MTFLGRSIGGGDRLFTPDNTPVTIDSFSRNTGDVWGKLPCGKQVHLNKMDGLSWNPYFIRKYSK